MTSRIVGHYRLLTLIGRGATSEVYAAEHALLGDKVAVKLLRPELASDPGQTQALVEEGARVRGIDHPNVVRVLDVGVDSATAGCYLVMEHVTGGTLGARMREGPLLETEVRRLGAAIADGIAAAHARGIVHRDLKPANIMLDGERPKIVDFGVAKHLGARSAVTTGRMIGTLAYMAPEQLSSGLIAPCTDVWALGVVLFEAIAGRHPFENFDDGRCAQLFDEPARASAVVELSPSLDAIIARCLSRDPSRRPSAEELARQLRGESAVDEERITVDAGPISLRGEERITAGTGRIAPRGEERATADAGLVPVRGIDAGRIGTPVTAVSRRRRVGIIAAMAAIAIAVGAIAALAVTRESDAASPAPPTSTSTSTSTSPSTSTSTSPSPSPSTSPTPSTSPAPSPSTSPAPSTSPESSISRAQKHHDKPRKTRKTSKETKDTKDTKDTKKETLD